jgi:hypothetical protein
LLHNHFITEKNLKKNPAPGDFFLDWMRRRKYTQLPRNNEGVQPTFVKTYRLCTCTTGTNSLMGTRGIRGCSRQKKINILDAASAGWQQGEKRKATREAYALIML